MARKLIYTGFFIVLGFLFLLNTNNYQPQNSQLFEVANNYYNEGEFELAIENYERIISNGEHSPEVYFNLANAYYKSNNIPSSIYYYEKALKLKPDDADIINNLGFAQNMTIDEIAATPQVGFNRIYSNLVNTFSFDSWSKIAVIAVVVFVILFLLYYFSANTNFKRATFIGSFVGIVVAMVSLFMAFQKQNIDDKFDEAIVFSKSIDIKSEPNSSSNNLFRLHEGTKVKIIDNLSGWSHIEIADGQKGWIPSETIKVL
jgi:tetratricopeptide (TPR) repeat protein